MRSQARSRPSLGTAHLFLARAARQARPGRSDREALHDFRVGLRRLRSLGRWLVREESTLDRERRSAIRRWLDQARGVQRRSSRLRDAEVREESTARLLSRAWLARRFQENRRLIAVGVQVLRNGLAACPARTGERDRRLDQMERRFWKALRRAMEGQPGRGDDPELHRLRIRAKRLRYAQEAFRGSPSRELVQAQEALGAFRDLQLRTDARGAGLWQRLRRIADCA
jgi:CHAD domain-containing protein